MNVIASHSKGLALERSNLPIKCTGENNKQIASLQHTSSPSVRNDVINGGHHEKTITHQRNNN